jgi:hypothetical protein
MPLKSAQDRDNMVGINRLALGDNVGINKTLAVKKRHEHLFRLTCMDFCLDGPRLTPFHPLLSLSFGFRCVVTNHCLVHGHYSVHHHNGVALDGGDEFSAGLDWLFFLLWANKPWHPSCCLISRPRSSRRILWMVCKDTPWATARVSMSPADLLQRRQPQKRSRRQSALSF